MKDFIRKFFKLEGYLIYRCWFEGSDVVIHVGEAKERSPVLSLWKGDEESASGEEAAKSFSDPSPQR